MFQITTTIPVSNTLALYAEYEGANEYTARTVLAIAVWNHSTGTVYVPVTLRDLTKRQYVAVERADLVPLIPDVMIQDADLFSTITDLGGESVVRQHKFGAWELNA
jgi:hypothetical protein